MTILVTGGTGFIGSHTCVELLQAGHEVIIVDNLCNSKQEVVGVIEQLGGKPVKFYKADIADRRTIQSIFKHSAVDAVIHFAGLKAVGESVQKPLAYYKNNITGTLVLLEAMLSEGCKRMVFSSSATVYGMNNPVPFREEYPISATNPYGYTKVMVEQILNDLCVADPQWSVVNLRYFNPIGAHKSGLIGENPNGIPNNLLPYVTQVALGKLPHLNVYGDDYDTVDGTGVRDYIHVCDLAAGHLKALEQLEHIEGARAWNLGTGHGSSVLEVVHAFEKASGKKVPYVIAPRRAGDIAECYADVTRAKEELHWEAKCSLEKMCADSWNYIVKSQQM